MPIYLINFAIVRVNRQSRMVKDTKQRHRHNQPTLGRLFYERLPIY